jgi:hypothetical protein
MLGRTWEEMEIRLDKLCATYGVHTEVYRVYENFIYVPIK